MKEETVQLMEAVDRSSQAAAEATQTMKDALLALPNMLATALATNSGARAGDRAAAPVTTRELRDKNIPDFWEHDPRAWF